MECKQNGMQVLPTIYPYSMLQNYVLNTLSGRGRNLEHACALFGAPFFEDKIDATVFTKLRHNKSKSPKSTKAISNNSNLYIIYIIVNNELVPNYYLLYINNSR